VFSGVLGFQVLRGAVKLGFTLCGGMSFKGNWCSFSFHVSVGALRCFIEVYLLCLLLGRSFHLGLG
jgi:hypothetical protein